MKVFSKSWVVLVLSALSLLMIAGCTGKARPVYPPAEGVRLAVVQRQDFVNAYLHGRWCDAEVAFEKSTGNFLAQDDFCSAARNYIIAYKLKSYSSVDLPELLERADDLASLDLEYVHGKQESTGLSVSKMDQHYLDLIENEQFSTLKSQLKSQDDPLFASVYARKAARAALRADQSCLAEDLVLIARDIDTRQGWVVFLIEDWKLLKSLSDSDQDRQAIEKRIDLLQKQIHVCPGVFEGL
jgi:hypothetical protein